MAWNDLSMSDKSRMMRLAINSGITDLRTIRDVYNSYAEGGPVKNYKNWKEQIERYKGIDTNDPDYDYEGFYNENPIRAWQMLEDNPKAHFTDKYKTESHPTLSNESIYANGRGGTWGEGTFELSDYLMQNSDRTLDYLRRNDPDIIPTYQGGIVLNSAGITDSFAEGGKIHIKPENRGKFTELKKRTGHSASWFKENGTPAQRKMATFALNARKWHHADGGYLFEEGGDTTEQIPQEEMTSQSKPSFGERIKNLNKKLWESVPATSGLTFPLAALSSGLYGGAQVMNKLLSSRDRESLGTVREIPKGPQYKEYFDATPEELEKAQIYLPKENGEWNTSSVGNYGDKHYDVLESRAKGLISAMKRAEFTQPEINRLSPLLLTQLILEGGWVLSRDDNNYGGMLDANGDHIAFDTEDSFYDSYLKNLNKRWGDEVMGEGRGWRNASTLKEYTDIINREDLGLHTKKAYNDYIRKHPKDSISIYTPWWENGDKGLMDHMKGIAPRARGLYWLLRQRMDAWDELARNNNIVK